MSDSSIDAIQSLDNETARITISPAHHGLASEAALHEGRSSARAAFSAQPLKVIPLVDGIDLFAGRRDLLAKLFVIGLGLLISKVGLS